jgi:hypothetical protein
LSIARPVVSADLDRWCDLSSVLNGIPAMEVIKRTAGFRSRPARRAEQTPPRCGTTRCNLSTPIPETAMIARVTSRDDARAGVVHPRPQVGAVRARRDEIVVHLHRPAELLATDPTGLLADDGDHVRTTTGVDELLGELLGRRHVKQMRQVVFTLPPAALTDDTARRLRTAIARWSTRRAEEMERESRVLWRQGLRSLRGGTALFLVGLLFSSDFLEPDVPELLQNVLGNGVFLVIAWVGLWYPLDLLFFARLPLRRERLALKVLARTPIEVRARDEARG